MLASEPSEKTQTQFASKYFKYVDLVNQLGQDLKIGNLSSTLVELSNLVLKDFVDQSTLKSNTLYCDIVSPYIISAITQDRGNVESLSGYRLSAGMKTAFSEANGDIKKIVPSLSAMSKIAEANQLITGITTENGQVASIQTTGLSSIISSLGSSTRSTTSEDYAITSITTQNGNVSDIGERKLDKVEVEATQQDGVEIARISVNNDVKILFAPKYTFDYNVKELSTTILSSVQEVLASQLANTQKFIGSFTMTTQVTNRMLDLRDYFQIEPRKEYFLRMTFKNYSTTAIRPSISAFTDNSHTLMSKDQMAYLTAYVSHTPDQAWKGNANTGQTPYPANFYTLVTADRCVFAINNVNANVYATLALYKFDDHVLIPEMLGSNECPAIVLPDNKYGYEQNECLTSTLPAFAFCTTTGFNKGNSNDNPYFEYNGSSLSRLPGELNLSGITDFQKIRWSRNSDTAASFGHQFANNGYLSKLSATNLTSIIPRYAFRNCYNLREAYFPELVGIQSSNGFRDCSKLQHAEFPKLQTIKMSGSLFSNNVNLQDLDFSSLRSIIDSTKIFEDCTSLQSISFPSLLELDNNDRMFLNCSNLSSIEFPQLSSIKDLTYMFSGCASLWTINFPMLLELNKSGGMFLSCSNLSSVEFPTLSSLDQLTTNQMFNYCKNLKILKMPAISSNEFPRRWGNGGTAFEGCTLPLSIYIDNVDSTSIGTLPNAIPRGSTIVCKDKTITTT